MLEITLLSKEHDRARFDCGVAELNLFLKSTARQHAEKGISRTFVLHGGPVILGFYALTLCEAHTAYLPQHLARKYPRHGLPAVRLARLGVALGQQGKGFGAHLLLDACYRTVLVAEQAGVIGLFVDAKGETACSFYEKFGFVGCLTGHEQLYLPYQSLEMLFS